VERPRRLVPSCAGLLCSLFVAWAKSSDVSGVRLECNDHQPKSKATDWKSSLIEACPTGLLLLVHSRSIPTAGDSAPATQWADCLDKQSSDTGSKHLPSYQQLRIPLLSRPPSSFILATSSQHQQISNSIDPRTSTVAKSILELPPTIMFFKQPAYKPRSNSIYSSTSDNGTSKGSSSSQNEEPRAVLGGTGETSTAANNVGSAPSSSTSPASPFAGRRRVS